MLFIVDVVRTEFMTIAQKKVGFRYGIPVAIYTFVHWSKNYGCTTNDPSRSGWLGFPAMGRKTTARRGFSRCGCYRAHSTRFANT